jgi:threonine dehydrogenase-like Zn-dependent dehydrogenase
MTNVARLLAKSGISATIANNRGPESLLADSALRVADLTTEIVGIEEAPRAFDLLREARTMKILIAPSRETIAGAAQRHP